MSERDDGNSELPKGTSILAETSPIAAPDPATRNRLHQALEYPSADEEVEPGKPRLVHATGVADFLMSQYGSLRGHPVWMGIGVNGIYTDELVLNYIEWALRHDAGSFWLVLAHELVAENKLAFKKPAFHEGRQKMRPGVEHFEIAGEFGPRRVPLFEDESAYEQTEEYKKYLALRDELRKQAYERQARLLDQVQSRFRFLDAARVMVAPIHEVYRDVVQEFSSEHINAIKTLFRTYLSSCPEFQQNIATASEGKPVVHWNKDETESEDTKSIAHYTIEQIMLTYFLARRNIGLKIGPETEQGPDSIYKNLMAEAYNIKLRNRPLNMAEGCLYLRQG